MKNSICLAAFITLVLLQQACREKPGKAAANVAVADASAKDTVLPKIRRLINDNTPFTEYDSLYFLLVPTEMTCNSCRDKAVLQAIDVHSPLPSNKWVIISSTSVKSRDNYFREIEKAVYRNSQIAYDTSNQAYRVNLLFTQPVIYASAAGHVYQKTNLTPVNIDSALHKFFTR